MANERILIVDDEKGVVRSCVRILQRHGFNVIGKTDSQSIPELLKQETFDLLLTDIRMPKLDGLELLQIAKKIDPNLTVILITGYGTIEDAIRAIRLGVQGFIMKPFEPEDLVTTVRDNLEQRALIQDSLRLQILLPLLELNQILQVSGGETSLARRALEIAYRQTRATRLAWLSFSPLPHSPILDSSPKNQLPTNINGREFIEMMVIPEVENSTSRLPQEAIRRVFAQAGPIWILGDGTLVDNIDGQPNVVGALLPMLIKGAVVGILTAERDDGGRSGPFDPISLNLLSVLAGQLAIILENAQLFQQTKTLHAFNEDIIRTMTNGLVAIDKDGYITAFNPAAAMMLGQNPEEVLYRPMPEAFVDALALTEIFFHTLRTGQAQSRQEITIRHRDGTQIHISVNVAPLTTDNEIDQPEGVVGVLEDLSEIKTLEAERRRLDRLAALGEMSAVVAHEIRNPIAGIAAGVEYLTRKIPKDSPDFEGAGMIQSEIKRVNRILEDILFVARPLKLNLSFESLSNIIEDVIQRCQPQITASRLKVLSEHTTNLPLLNVDRQRFEQVFTNLIINATQAMPDGGELKLQTGILPPNGRTPKQVVITISDNGPGIPTDIHRRIFEPFFTTKTKGTGLGLPVARRIIEEHQGTLEIENLEQKGTRFIIKLPIEKDAAL